MQQILVNLLDNAVKYTPANGSIECRVTIDKGWVAIDIRDTGIGIPRDDLPRIFERFYRVDKARSREFGGTGLGLLKKTGYDTFGNYSAERPGKAARIERINLSSTEGIARLSESHWRLVLMQYQVQKLGFWVVALSLFTTHGAKAQKPEPVAIVEVAASANELAELRVQVRQLIQRIDELEKKQQATVVPRSPTVNATRSKTINISGYSQLRFFHQGLGTGGVTPTESINHRRTRLALDFTLSPSVKGFLQTDWATTRPEGTVSLRDVYVDLLTKGPSVRIGQQKFPMLIETDDGDLVVWPLERALLTTRLMPDERDRGITLTLRDHRKNAPPLSLLLGAMNGTGINQNATLAGKVLLAGLYYNTPPLEARAWSETGDFQTAAPNAIVRGPRQRVALSVRGNFGRHLLPDQGKYGYRFSLMGAWASGRGDFPGRQGTSGAGLLTSGVLNYTPNRVDGWYLEPVMILTKNPIPIRLIGRYEEFNTNRDVNFAKIFQAFGGIGFDVTKNVRFIVGYTQKVDQTLASFRQRAVTVETQLAF